MPTLARVPVSSTPSTTCPALRHAGPRFRRALLTLAALAAAALCSAQRGAGDYSTPNFPDGPSVPLVRAPLFFPPYPPPLGRAISRGPSPGDPRLPSAPPELASYVNEIFYPALGSRLINNSLKEPLRCQLDAYRALKLELQNQLRTELARVHEAGDGARAHALQTLARIQAPRLVQLEKDAEQLRRDLQMGDHTFNSLREWRLGDHERRGFSPIEIAQVMRSYAYYHHGLLPAQRRLLREISIELLLSAEDAAKATAAQPHVFFPPEPARVLFPDHLSPEAAAKLAAYQTKKSQLKKELYDTIYKHDGAAFNFLRRTLSTLAEKQARPLAELEQLAEEVRRLLPPSREIAPPPERSRLPVALQERIGKLMTSYATAQKDAATRIDAIVSRAKSLPFQSNYRFDPDGLKFVVVPTRFARGDPAALRQIEAIRAEIGAIAEDYGRQLADLINERHAILAAAGEALGTDKSDAIESAVLGAMRAVHQRQNEASYDEYRIAVFEPGLSPEQRRLLFDGLIERLELPLPRAEPQPTRRTNSW